MLNITTFRFYYVVKHSSLRGKEAVQDKSEVKMEGRDEVGLIWKEFGGVGGG